MGLTTSTLALSNPKHPELNPIHIDALANTGALHLCIPYTVAQQLQLEEVDTKVVILADGNQRMVPYVGPIQITFQNRTGFTGALVMGDLTLLGTIPMDDMDLAVIPKTQSLAVNPESPIIGVSVAR